MINVYGWIYSRMSVQSSIDPKPFETINVRSMNDSYQIKNNHELAISLKGKSVLVTGASGFIGTALCKELQKAGGIVHGISRHTDKMDEGCDHWWRCDLSDASEVNRI